MADSIKCTCSHCGAKYRLPVEAQGRTARCKRCGEKFAVPREESLEDSILSWLDSPAADEAEDAVPAPRVISMPTDENQESNSGRRVRGTIRMKEQPSDAKPEAK